MRPKDFIPTLQHKVAVSAVGPSALRGQGGGVLSASQAFLASLSLARLPKSMPRTTYDLDEKFFEEFSE